MKASSIITHTLLSTTIIAALASCSKDDKGNSSTNGGNESGNKYFISATYGAAGGSTTTSYILTANDIENVNDTLSIVGNGLELPYSYTWVFNENYNVASGLYYQKGDPGLGTSYKLDQNGSLTTAGSDYQLVSRFTTYGPFSKYLVTSVGGATNTAGDTISIFNFIDLENGNAITTKDIATSNFTGNGGFATFCGIVDMGNGEFLTSAVVSSTSAASGGASTGTVQYPDSVWVAAFDANLNLKRIYRDNRISYSAGRYRSQYYSQIAPDGNGNCYVFSGSYESTTTKHAGALRILNGATTFDPSYYFDIEQASGGYKFRKVWHILDAYYIVEFYNTIEVSSTAAATKYAIVNTESKSLNWVSGLPAIDAISSTGLPFTANGKCYIPVTETGEKPAIYNISPNTAVAAKGLVIDAVDVTAVGKLSY